MMQGAEGGNAWYAYLQAVRRELEKLSPQKKGQAAGALLGRLNWHCNNEAAGYFLGHMEGMTSDLTALLVVALGDQAYEEDTPPPEIVEGLWAEAERFLPLHPGSRRAKGGRLPRELPCIMIITKYAPTVTPESSVDHRELGPNRSDKRRCLRLQIEVAVDGRVQGEQQVQVPLRERDGAHQPRDESWP